LENSGRPGLKSYSSFGGVFDAGTHSYDWLKTAVAEQSSSTGLAAAKQVIFRPGGEGSAAFSVLPLPGKKMQVSDRTQQLPTRPRLAAPPMCDRILVARPMDFQYTARIS